MTTMGFWSRPQTYTVHEGPSPASDRADRAEAMVFVREGFSLSAYLFGPIWLLLNGLWLALVAYVGIACIITIIVATTGMDQRWSFYAFAALNFLVGFEADSLRRWTLERRGWRQIGAVSGATQEDCERRFFEHWLTTVPAVAADRLTPPGTPGGLSPAATSRTAPPSYQGDLIPPKRAGWRSALSFSRRN
jgi:Protein of unknown function (DUF2628)